MTAMDTRPRRSVLYMPGSNLRALEKARTVDADCLILDLEDAVAPEAKGEARAQVVAALAEGGFGFRELIVRINGFDTPWGADDLAAVATMRPDAVLVPKVSGAEDIVAASTAMGAAGAAEATRLWVMMETPAAILNAAAIAGVRNTRLSAFVMGTNDLAKDTGARIVPHRAPMLPWLMTCVAAARAHGLAILDGVYNDFKNEAGFSAECVAARDMGFDGKTLIHPAQVAPCNATFSPSQDEIDWASAVIAAFDHPHNAGKGALQVNGKMVERLHADMARKVMVTAKSIAQRASCP